MKQFLELPYAVTQPMAIAPAAAKSTAESVVEADAIIGVNSPALSSIIGL